MVLPNCWQNQQLGKALNQHLIILPNYLFLSRIQPHPAPTT